MSLHLEYMLPFVLATRQKYPRRALAFWYGGLMKVYKYQSYNEDHIMLICGRKALVFSFFTEKELV